MERDAVSIDGENCPEVGTYLKVARSAETENPDLFFVLYLRPDGRFLFLGYWPGYEQTVAAGVWSKNAREISLHGGGTVAADFAPGGGGQSFERVLTMGDQQFTPTLTADIELEGWSMLGWRGPFEYVGQQTVIDPTGRWLPNSIAAVDVWIDRIARP
jgi:hypothetical protein